MGGGLPWLGGLPCGGSPPTSMGGGLPWLGGLPCGGSPPISMGEGLPWLGGLPCGGSPPTSMGGGLPWAHPCTRDATCGMTTAPVTSPGSPTERHYVRSIADFQRELAVKVNRTWREGVSPSRCRFPAGGFRGASFGGGIIRRAQDRIDPGNDGDSSIDYRYSRTWRPSPQDLQHLSACSVLNTCSILSRVRTVPTVRPKPSFLARSVDLLVVTLFDCGHSRMLTGTFCPLDSF